MKKIIFIITILGFAINYAFATDSKTIVVASSVVPHADILKLIKPDIEKAGYKLDIRTVNENIQNTLLEEGSIDANFFQTPQYLEEFTKSRGIKSFKIIAYVHIEPMSAYSYKYKSINDIEDGAKVGIPNNPSNETRALKLLESQGLIKLKPRKDGLETKRDIISNPKKLQISALEAESLPAQLKAGSLQLAIFNGNIAKQNNLTNIAFFSESSINNNYSNVLVISDKTSKDKADILVKYITSKKVYDYIINTYKDGSVIPAFEPK